MPKVLFAKWTLLAIFLHYTITMNAQSHKEQTLIAQQRSIISISALTATGDLQKLKVQLNTGLDSGLTVSQIKEVLVQLYAYCGFPRSLNGINTFMAVIAERTAKGIKDAEGKDASPIPTGDKYQTGKKTLQSLTGREEKALSGANAFAPAIDTFLKEHLFADIFSRDVLDYQQRELVTVSALAAMSGVAPQLQAHIGMAINTGLTPEQLQEAFAIIGNTIGKTEGDLAISMLKNLANGNAK
jgi:4-carboxymuconolactone decarboxylase